MGVAAGIALVASSALAGTTAADRTASKQPTLGVSNVQPGSVRFDASSIDNARPAGLARTGSAGVPVGVDGGCVGTPEGEVCAIPIPSVDDFNGGCNSTNQDAFSLVAVDEVICGSTGDDAAFRDTDWYEVVIPAAGNYGVFLTTAGNAAWGFIGDAVGPVVNPTCATIAQINPVATGNGGVVTADLVAGTYWVFVSTNGFNNQGCFDYEMVISDTAGLTGACCLPDATCVDGQSIPDCDALGGTFQGDGSECATTECVAGGCGAPDAGDCCVANGTPFCNDAECCEQICAADPFCCDTSWDGICAGAAAAECAVCNLPGACCLAFGECQDLSEIECDALGGIFQGAGTECATTECPFIEPPANATCDTAQVIEASDVNGPAIAGSNFFGGPEAGLPACGAPVTGDAVWYVYNATTLGSQTITVSTCATAGGGGGGGSDCCTVGGNGTPGCDDPDCEALICGLDPFCCDNTWDGICADAALAKCTVCEGAGPDPEANPDTVINVFTNTFPDFCLGTFCCVGGNDDFCGLYSSFTFCADDANFGGQYFIVVSGFGGATGDFLLEVAGDGVECDAAIGSCIECEVGDDLEGEPCPTGVDAFNGGCNSDAVNPPLSPLSVDTWVCGTADAAGGTRDTDWYEVNIAVDGTYDVVFEAGFEGVAGFIGASAGNPLVNPDCGSISVIAVLVTPAPCTQGVVSAELEAGTYWVFAGPLNFEGVTCPDGGECPGNGRYRLQVRLGVPAIPCVVDCPMGALVECQDCEDFLPLACGDAGTGDCCIANGTPFCDDAACCEQICAADPFCCDTQWDQICADAAVVGCAICGGGGGSNCCIANGGLGCDDPDCEALICGADPFCCDTQWDQVCADAALAGCAVCDGGGGGGSNCCNANGGLGCDDPDCEALICGADPFCCDTQWDQICADAAIAGCAVCQGGGLGEAEDCNGGCNNVGVPTFDEIACGDTVCGTITAGEGLRDTDWYLVEVTNPGGAVITATLEAEFPGVVFILDVPSCDAVAILGETGFSECIEGVTNSVPAVASVGPGTYVVFVSAGNPDGSGVFDGIDCNDNEGYVLTVTGDCGGAVCVCTGDIDGNCTTDSDDLGILLSNFGSSVPVGTNGDLDDDGDVDSDDLGILLSDFGCVG
ncbi:MAG: hypothetical protein ACTS3F_05875 [Phycisphaerales bacterium]